MRHAVIGAGFGARVHLPAFASLPGVEVVALADAGSGRATALAGGDMAAYSDWRRLLDEQRPDSLSVAVPPAAQSEIVAAAIDRGIHVLCEKPVGLSPKETAALANRAAAASVVAAVGFQFRFESGMTALRRHARSATLGRVRRIDFSWITSGSADPARLWRWQHDGAVGGGIINGFLSHAADLLHWHCGTEIIAVAARAAVLVAERYDTDGARRPVTAEDMVDALCELSDGAVASLRITNCQIGGDGMRIEVYGERGVLRYHHRPPFTGGAGLSFEVGDGCTELPTEDTADAGGDSRLGPMRSLAGLFADAVGGGAAAELPTFTDALRSQRLLAAVRVATTNGCRVALS